MHRGRLFTKSTVRVAYESQNRFHQHPTPTCDDYKNADRVKKNEIILLLETMQIISLLDFYLAKLMNEMVRLREQQHPVWNEVHQLYWKIHQFKTKKPTTHLGESNFRETANEYLNGLHNTLDLLQSIDAKNILTGNGQQHLQTMLTSIDSNRSKSKSNGINGTLFAIGLAVAITSVIALTAFLTLTSGAGIIAAIPVIVFIAGAAGFIGSPVGALAYTSFKRRYHQRELADSMENVRSHIAAP